MKRLRVKFSNDAARSTLRYCVLTACLLSSPLKATTVVYPLSYSARLTDGNGSPLEGLIDVDVKFFATESSTTLLGQNFLFTGVALNQGVLTLSINMMDSQVAAVFGDGSEAVYIELTAGGKTYPRQRYSFVPLALRVPIDQKTLSFDGSGKLGISLKTQPGTNQFLTKNGNGELTWGSPAVVTASSIQGKTVSSTTPQAGQILTYSGSEWIPQTPVNGSGSGTLSVGLGGTGATSFTNNGVLIGAGAGPISATAAGTQENVLKVGASGPEFGKVNLASAEAVTGKLALANGGTGSDLTTTGGSGQYVKQSTTGGPLSVGTIQPEDITTALGSMLATATASGTGPGWSASGNTHTLSIPMASNAGVAAGLLSNGDYATFASKLGSVSAGTGITASPSGSSVTVGLDTAGTAGTYVKVTTDAYGRVVSGATLSTSDLPPLTAMVGADGNVAGKAGAVPAPAATDDAKFLRGDGTWSTPPATAGGAANEIQYNSSGMLTGNSSFVYAAGNVGIGSTSPGAALDISGQIKIQGGSPGVGKVLTSDADGLATWSTAAVGSITGVTAGTGLTGGGTSGSVTLNADVGTTANKLVQLDATAKLPAIDGSALTNLNPTNLSSAVAVSKGGTGLTSGTSGGIPYFNAASTMASSAALTNNGVVLGGGAGAAPTATAAGAANSVLLVPSGGGAPSFGAIDVSQSNAVTGTLNLGNGGTGTSLLVTGGTGQYLKQSASGAAVTVGTIAATDLPTMVGDSGSGGTKGVVPAPASGDTAAGKFLRADGSWSVPTGTTNWAAPGTIGSTTPNTGAFTTLTASGNVGIGTGSPGSMFAVGSASQFSVTSTGNLTRVNNIPYSWPTTQGTVNQVLRNDGAGNLSWVSASTGSVTSVTGTAPISVATGTTTPVISISEASATTSGVLSSTDWTTFNAKQAAGNYITQLSGDMTLSGFASGTATATLPSVAIAGTSTKVTYDVKGRVLSGTSLAAADIPALSAGIITSGTLNVANGGTGATSLALNNVILGNGTSPVQAVAPGTSGNVLTSNGTTWQSTSIWPTPGAIGSTTPNTGAFTSITTNAQAGYEAKPFGIAAGNTSEVRFDELAANGTNYVGFKAPDTLAANKVWVLPAADGTAGQVLKTDGVGNLSWVSAAIGSVTNVTGTAPISVATGTSTPVISISQANTTTSGFLSAADWTTFNAKQAAGNYITQLTGDMTLSGFAGGTATATLPSVAIAGTSTKVTYDVKGRVLSGTSLAATDIPALSAGIITSGTLNVANGGTGATSLTLNNVILGNGTSPVQAVAPGTSGNVLTSNGTTWQSTALPATTWATPGTIGSTTPNTGAFTSITTNAQAGYEAKPFGVTAGNTGEVRFDELAANGTNYVGFKAPDTLAANKVWVLPGADGTAGQVLKTDGVGNLSWVSAATGSVTSVGITAPAAGITVTGGPITSSGSMTLALSNDLAAVESLATTGGVERTGADTWATYTLTAAGKALLDDADATAQRTTLGLGTLATAAAVSGGVGGTITDATIINADIATTAAIATSKLSGPVTAITGNGLGTLASASAVSGGLGGTITDGTITNADISATAAIADSKLATISTAGKVSGTAITSGNITTSGAIASSAQGAFEAKPFGIAAGNTSEVRFDELAANGTNYVGFKAPDTLAANKVWVLPAADGTAGQVLKTDGTGNLSWVSAATGSVTNVTGTAPISVATGTSTPVISISQANTTTSGFLSAADWTTFNAKQAAGNYITQLSGDMTLSGFASGTATATLPSVAIAGTSTKVTYDVKGRVLSGTSLAAVDIPALSAGIITSGTLNVANGGTGATSLTLNNVILGNGTSPVQAVAPGTSGNVLTSNGTTWVSSTPSSNWTTSGSDVYRSSGNVGIGTTAPAFTLDVNGTAQIRGSGATYAPNGGFLAGGNYSATTQGANLMWNLGAGSGFGGETDFVNNHGVGSGGFAFYDVPAAGTIGSPIMVLRSSGNVGIGTTSPLALLHVLGGDGLFQRVGAGDGAVLLGGGNQYLYGNNSSGNINIGTNALVRVTINSSGNVGIGTTAPAAKLDVVGQVRILTYTAGANTTTVDFTNGNNQTTVQSAAGGGTINITLNNMLDGATYTLAFQNTQGATYTFSGSGVTTWKFLPPNAPTTSGKDTLYTMMRMGNSVYITWMTGF